MSATSDKGRPARIAADIADDEGSKSASLTLA